ncbi:KH domain-containing, RNA-binding, signal transduction-associated protein 1b [Corythoichthys intestinalis]|uniref:KH domain-containing, RNA-binding, signal transduction-associated protein 1b n=1 Tax=Corythoichthys intestinalis TaxID=161448 RepID=UPI0025A5D8EF|nr:KH domain-containing, RNA-binding, signal transduction-associated protein 1b [Corythoichthys intestinalis]XP_061808681.1 KH domain-containing, RNA-binding, signal transduction-associated protein 1-like isoform X2 [Nerophis lumbriciformis]
MENGDNKYLPELLAEKDSLDQSFTHAMKLLEAEIERVQKGESKESDTYLDLFTNKFIKLKERVLIPVKQYPKFNFVGKILGPQGNTIKRLQEELGAKISVLGKGSMRDKTKEEELRNGGEPKYAHLSMELHVFIEVYAPVPEAYVRMANAMGEVKKFLFPDVTDDICQEQFMEMGYLNGGPEQMGRGRGGMPMRGRGGPPGPHRGRGMPPRGGVRGARGAGRGMPAGRGAAAAAAAARGAPAARGARPPVGKPAQRMLPHQHTPAAVAESYEQYAYDESYADQSYESYDSYYSQPQAEGEYYDYGHGDSAESYENFAQDDWNGTQRAAPGKAAPAARGGTKTPFRQHPYQQY